MTDRDRHDPHAKKRAPEGAVADRPTVPADPMAAARRLTATFRPAPPTAAERHSRETGAVGIPALRRPEPPKLSRA